MDQGSRDEEELGRDYSKPGEKGLEQSSFCLGEVPLLSQCWADLHLLPWKLELSRDNVALSRGAISKLLRALCSVRAEF